MEKLYNIEPYRTFKTSNPSTIFKDRINYDQRTASSKPQAARSNNQSLTDSQNSPSRFSSIEKDFIFVTTLSDDLTQEHNNCD